MVDDNFPTDDGGVDVPPAPVPEGSAADELLTAGPRRRRRPPRSWSTTGQADRFDRPVTESAWGWQQPQQAPVAPTAEPTSTPVPPVPPPGAAPRPAPPQPELPPRPGLAPIGPAIAREAPPTPEPGVADLLQELREEFGQLREALTSAPVQRSGEDAAIVTAAELASVIESLGVSLGNGMATLLSDHRALLARDIEAGADRVLEDVGRRLRTTANQVIDGVEAKVRHLHAQNQASLADQIDARIDQLQADVVGLRAVMLEIPDQTEVTTRLDLIADGLAELNAERARDAVSSRVSPGLLNALEATLAGPMERIEELLGGATEQLLESVESQRQAQFGEIDGERITSDAAGMAQLTKEIVALRRRVGLRADAKATELTAEQLDAIADRVAARLQGATSAASPEEDDAAPVPARRARKAPAKAESATAAPRRRSAR